MVTWNRGVASTIRKLKYRNNTNITQEHYEQTVRGVNESKEEEEESRRRMRSHAAIWKGRGAAPHPPAWLPRSFPLG
jgi:hypothetical protein